MYNFFSTAFFLHVKGKKDVFVCICTIICIMLFCVLLCNPSIIMVKNVNVITVQMTVFALLKVNGF